jgi:hypothetical protein
MVWKPLKNYLGMPEQKILLNTSALSQEDAKTDNIRYLINRFKGEFTSQVIITLSVNSALTSWYIFIFRDFGYVYIAVYYAEVDESNPFFRVIIGLISASIIVQSLYTIILQARHTRKDRSRGTFITVFWDILCYAVTIE